jgi:hypothetical protein
MERAELQAQVKGTGNEKEKEENNIGEQQDYGSCWD